ncbi:GAF domain-containing protein [Henriciella aquimarina]|uniref:GAF domain-containing protein n=1 Tax=Henriciella aquimarina TaxID=545261 RepID=UPI00117AFC2C|nr:GAF domain-containing protein [Henriciella aquimarina]
MNDLTPPGFTGTSPGISEAARIRFLEGLNILNFNNDRELDDLVENLAAYFSVPMASFSLIGRRQQWTKASVGINYRLTDRAKSFCTHVVRSGQPMVVSDTLKDPRFSRNPFVIGDPNIRFYAGSPVVLDQHVIGALCLIDTTSRILTGSKLRMLAHFSVILGDIVEYKYN